MKVIMPTTKKQELYELSIGDTFICNDTLFLFCDVDLMIDLSTGFGYDPSLTTELFPNEGRTEVEQVECEIKVKRM